MLKQGLHRLALIDSLLDKWHKKPRCEALDIMKPAFLELGGVEIGSDRGFCGDDEDRGVFRI